MNRIKVLVVDHSSARRATLSEIVGAEPDMRVVGAAPALAPAQEMIDALDPDVLMIDAATLQAEAPDSLDRLGSMRPALIVTSPVGRDSRTGPALRAFEMAVVDFPGNAMIPTAQHIPTPRREIADRIRAAARARPLPAPEAASLAPVPAGAARGNAHASADRLVAIGASTGGTDALREFLAALPASAPACVVTQHMPAGFTRAFAQRLDTVCRIRVKEAEDGERIVPGCAYIAPGARHLAVRRESVHYVAMLLDDPPVNRHKPSVEVLFRSVAKHAGRSAIGVMMTGMGKDGAVAMLEMRHAGAYNFAQDESSSVVFGMPREAIAVGAVHEVAPLAELASRVCARLSGVRIGVPDVPQRERY